MTEVHGVWTWRRRLPAGNLNRTRLAAVSIGTLAVLTELPQLGNPLHCATYNALAGVAVLLILGLMILTYVRRKTQWWCLVPMPMLIAFGGSGMRDPVVAMAFAMASTLVLSLYGSMLLWSLRLLGSLIAVPAAVALSPMSSGRVMEWDSATVIGVLPQIVLMSVMTRVLFGALMRQERDSAAEFGQAARAWSRR